jgi:sec-independent protein translocase protein TatC
MAPLKDKELGEQGEKGEKEKKEKKEGSLPRDLSDFVVTEDESEGESGDESEGESGEKEQSFLEHFAELRRRVIIGLLIVIPFIFIAYKISDLILNFLSGPLMALMPEGRGLIATALPETFLVHLKIALWAGLIISSPFWLYQVWAFVAPGLYKNEKSVLVKLTLLAFFLLLAGGAFAYYVVLPIGFKFFLGFGGGTVTILPVIHEYLSLVMTLILAFGCAFELPLFLMFLAHMGFVNSEKLKKFRQYAILIIVILAAFLTPPDVVSQILMSIPMYGLYELSLLLIRQREKAKEAREAKEKEEESQEEGQDEGQDEDREEGGEESEGES